MLDDTPDTAEELVDVLDDVPDAVDELDADALEDVLDTMSESEDASDVVALEETTTLDDAASSGSEELLTASLASETTADSEAASELDDTTESDTSTESEVGSETVFSSGTTISSTEGGTKTEVLAASCEATASSVAAQAGKAMVNSIAPHNNRETNLLLFMYIFMTIPFFGELSRAGHLPLRQIGPKNKPCLKFIYKLHTRNCNKIGKQIPKPQ